MISKEELLRAGKNKGLNNKEHIEKNYFQDVFLFNLYRKTNLFVFKGGTALYKLYNLPRFSEDLDFSLVEAIAADEIKKIIHEAASESDFFSIKDIKKTRDSLLAKISCKGILTKYNTLRIDVSLKNKILGGYDVKNYVPDYIDINPFSLKVLKPEEMISEKIHSLFNRQKARDLYDLFFLLRSFKLDIGLTEKKLQIFSLKFSKNKIKERISNLKTLWFRELTPFVLGELPEFNLVRDYVLEKL